MSKMTLSHPAPTTMSRRSAKGRLLLMTLLLLTFVCGTKAIAQNEEAYAYISYSNPYKLIFFYDDLRSERNSYGRTYEAEKYAQWFNSELDVIEVEFNSSFANARLHSLCSQFRGMENLASIIGMGYLNTEEVRDMSDMFYGCKNLTSIDVSGFNTSKVKDMSRMFEDCEALISLDLSNFDTRNVTNMKYMFYKCSNLRSLNVSSFDTRNVTNMSYMFKGLQKLTSLDLSNFDTQKVEDMERMFEKSTGLTEINLAYFSTASLQNAQGMFRNCNNLTTIYVGGNWDNMGWDGSDMFQYSTSLVGGAGTTFDSNHYDSSYARIDAPGTPGYFTGVPTSNRYAILSADGRTLTFYHDNCSRPGTRYALNEDGNTPAWSSNCANVTTVVFDSSFADYTPNNMNEWFAGMTKLTTITGWENLNTSNVTSMARTFYGCTGLKCLDLTAFNTQGVLHAEEMFRDCSNLSAIFVGDEWQLGPQGSGTDMFKGCLSLVGARGTIYDANNVGMSYAHLDAENNPGYLSYPTYVVVSTDGKTLTYYYDLSRDARDGESYYVTNAEPRNWAEHSGTITTVDFDASFASVHPVFTNGWFADMPHLAEFSHIENLNTDKVRDMSRMFYGCSQLALLDLSSFNTERVTNMSSMFEGCSALVTVYVGDQWNCGTNTNTSRMFYGCTHIKGCKGTGYDASYVDYRRAHIDATDNPGYFSIPAYAMYENGRLTFYCDQQKSRTGKKYYLNMDGNAPEWVSDGTNANITHVVFHSSFANARPVSTASWFDNMIRLATITDMKYLNTSQVTNMSGMFKKCMNLQAVDLTSFNTGSLQNTENMFYECSNLTTIYVSNDWDLIMNLSSSSSNKMFYGCVRLVGCAGTTFNYSKTNHEYAHIDEEDNPGYFSVGEPYAELSTNGQTLTFYCDLQRSTRQGNTYDLNTGDNLPVWYSAGVYNNVTMVEFHSSFAHTRPTSTNSWFAYMSHLTCITGLEYLKTNQVTNMTGMFLGCSGLASLNLSSFNTANVTKMSSMFSGCTGIAFLDLSSFNTSKVTDMSRFFEGCTYLNSFYIPSFNTAKVTTMERMFADCSRLPQIYLRQFNTGNVVNMAQMFEGCSNLSVLDLSSFNTSKVTDMNQMFTDCTFTSLNLSSFNTSIVQNMTGMFTNCLNLTTIYAGDGWSTAALQDPTARIFVNCPNLVGSAGTAYDGFHLSASYAHIDGGTSNPGYLSFALSAYLSTDGRTLTFYCDDANHPGTRYQMNVGGGAPTWTSDATNVTTVVFDSSFANARPISTASWFSGMSLLTTITGIEYLNTSQVTNMFGMFYGCSSLTSLDLSTFDTSSATNMNRIFDGCSSLTNLDVSNFNTEQATSMTGMFEGCSSLSMLDLSSFNTSRVTSIGSMFKNCTNLVAIYVGDQWNVSGVTNLNSYNMFFGCTNLVGMNGTKYDSNYTDKGYAHIDDGGYTGYLSIPTYAELNGETLTFYCDQDKASRTGTVYLLTGGNGMPKWYTDGSYANVTEVVFSGSMKKTHPTSTANWFLGMSNLTSITGLSRLNTNCVKYMNGMFQGCSQLTTISVETNWDFSDMASSDNMFTGCTSLVGGNGTTYTTLQTDGYYARIDKPGTPGYFTGLPRTYAALSTDQKTLTFYCDKNRDAHTQQGEETYDTEGEDYFWPGWQDYTWSITNIVFDPSFAQARPLSIENWFSYCYELLSITGLENLNTSEVTSMAYMFNGCEKLTSLNLSSFQTENVTSMQCMFNNCYALGELDLSTFNTTKVTNMNMMFNSCSELTTIYVSNNWSIAAVGESSSMFDGCENLVGGNGTTYNSSNTDTSYAHIDEADNPGYLTYKAEFIPGDVNGDGYISIADVTMLIDIVLGNISSYNAGAANVNGDSKIDIGDVNAIVNLILNGSTTTP
jgi:surface protein